MTRCPHRVPMLGSFGEPRLEGERAVIASSARREQRRRGMKYHSSVVLVVLCALGCGGGTLPSASPPASPDGSASPADENASSAKQTSDDAQSPAKSAPPANDEFQVKDSTTAGAAHGVKESKLKPTKTEALMKFIVVDKADEKPIPGIVVSLVSKDGKKFYTEETDALGYSEVLVPVGQDYELVYLSLGKKDINAKVSVKDKPNQNIKLTLRYKKRVVEKKAPAEAANEPGFVLDGVNFQSGKATILPESFPRLDSVLEFMTHKKSVRIIITGHTDNVGKPASNKLLSEKRAQACKDYMVERGIDASRIEAVGFGDEQPIAPNETEEGRQRNRRIEAKEL